VYFFRGGYSLFFSGRHAHWIYIDLNDWT